MTKKILAGALAGLMVISSASALACDKDSFIGYDIPDAQGRYGKLYYCPELGKTIIDGYASTVEWVHAFYEAEYPHKEVQTLVLDGKNTKMTRYSGNFANAEVDLRPDFWEAKYPYSVYNRIYSNLENAGFKATDIIGYAGQRADVKVSDPIVGFDRFAVVDGEVYNYDVIYDALDEKLDFDLYHYNEDKKAWLTDFDELIDAYYDAVTYDNGEFTDEFLSGDADVAYSIFDNTINQVAWEKLDGPDYFNGGRKVIVPMAELGAKLDERSKKSNVQFFDNFHPEYYDDVLAYEAEPTLDVRWETAGYEKEYPYRIYQVLVVNGIKLDGRYVKTPGNGQRKAGEEIVGEYDIDVLKNADNIYTVSEDDNDLIYRPEIDEFSAPLPHSDYDLHVFPRQDITNRMYYDKYNIFNDFMPWDDVIPGYDEISIRKNLDGKSDYEDKIYLTKNILEDKLTKLPYVFRYTGGIAHPAVEWKVAWPEADYPYTIYEEKYLDGKPTGIYRSTETSAEAVPEIYEPNPKMGNSYRVLRVNLSGDNIQDVCLHNSLIADGYDFIVSGEEVAFYRIPACLYLGHEFPGAHGPCPYVYGDLQQYTAELVDATYEEALEVLFSK